MFSNIIKLFKFLGEYLQDFCIAVRYNTYSPFEEKDRKLFYRIVILSHAIEKGLSLTSPRHLFGREKLEELMHRCADDPKFSTFPLQMARGAIFEYVRAHRKLGLTAPFLDTLEQFANDKALFTGIEAKGGIKTNISVYKDISVDNESCLALLRSRFSCRSYQPQVLPSSLIRRLIAGAEWAPSQCNRQSVRVHCYQDKIIIEELLLLQGGSAGFYQGVFNLFIVTSETTAWGGFGQRNQGYVDGGLLAQELLLACHAHGIGACPLNLAVGNAHEKKIKLVANIHQRERLVMMIAFGYPAENGLKAANSPRLPVEHILTQH